MVRMKISRPMDGWMDGWMDGELNGRHKDNSLKGWMKGELINSPHGWRLQCTETYWILS